jgi:hypothetical protein
MAALAMWLLLMLPRLLTIGSGSIAGLLLVGVTFAVIVFVVSRLGMLAMASAQFFYFMGVFFTYTMDFSAWYAGSTFFGLFICITFAIYGFYTSMAGQPLVRAEPFHE